MGLRDESLANTDCPSSSVRSALSLSLKLGLTCLRYRSLNNPTVSLFLWHIFVFFRLPIIYIVVFTPLTHLLSWSTFICIVVHCEIFVQNQCRTCRSKEVRLRRSDDFILNKRCVAQIIFSKTLESCVLFLLQWSRTAFASKVHRTRNVRECVTMTL